MCRSATHVCRFHPIPNGVATGEIPSDHRDSDRHESLAGIVEALDLISHIESIEALAFERVTNRESVMGCPIRILDESPYAHSIARKRWLVLGTNAR
jgi:hypothetical protein